MTEGSKNPLFKDFVVNILLHTHTHTHTHTFVQISETVWMEEKRMDYQPGEKKIWATQITAEGV